MEEIADTSINNQIWNIDKFITKLTTQTGNLTELWKSYELHANTQGFTFSETCQLIDQLINTNLEYKHCKKIILSLFPNEQLDSNLILKIISRFRFLLMNYNNSDLLKLVLKWIILIWEIINNRELLEGYYGIIWHFIEFESIRPYICIILHKLTRFNHVKKFRIRQIIELQSKFGYSTELTELLLTYKLYKPSEVQLTKNQLKFNSKRLFKQYWEEDKSKKLSFISKFNNWQLNKSYNFIGVNKLVETNISGTKRALVNENILNLNLPTGKILLETINTSSDLITQSKNLYFNPNYLINLNHPLIYQLFKLNPNELVYQNQLQYCNLILQLDPNPITVNKILEYLLEFSQNLGYFPIDLVPEIFGVLETWNGLDFELTLFPLLELLKPLESTDLKTYLLNPLKKLFTEMDHFLKIKIMKLVTNLLTNWSTWFLFEFNRKIEHLTKEEVEDFTFNGFEGGDFSIHKFLDTLTTLFSWFEKLSLIMIQKYKFNFWILHNIFNFLEIHSQLWLKFKIPQIIIPSKFLLLTFSLIPHGMSLSRLGTLLNNYRKSSFEADTISRESAHPLTNYLKVSKSQINLLNSLTTDICNMLWRNRLFHKDEIAMGLFINPDLIRELSGLSTYSGSLFNLSNNLGFFNFEELDILLQLLSSYQVRLPNTINPNTPASVELFKYLPIENSSKQELYGKYRTLLMKAIERRGYMGIINFLYSTIASLHFGKETKEPVN